jgi:PmbA protein
MEGEKIVAAAIEAALAAGADQAAVALGFAEKSELNVDAGRMSLFRTTGDVSLTVTAYSGGRKGSSAVNRADPEAARAAAREAAANAASAEPDAANAIAPAAPPLAESEGGESPDRPAMLDRMAEFLDFAGAQLPEVKLEQCILDFTRSERFFGNSNGIRAVRRDGLYGFSAMFTAKSGEKTSSFNGSGAWRPGLDAPLKDWGRVEPLLRQSMAELDARPLDGAFTGDLIISADCLDEFLGALVGVYLADYPLITKTSPFLDKLGQPVAAAGFTLRSLPRSPLLALRSLATPDGFAAADCDLIRDGKLTNFCLSLYGANKSGRPRCPSGGAVALAVEPGGSTLAELIGGVERGLLLGRFSGGEPSPGGDLSGVAKNSFYIEDGRLSHPVTETMIAGNIGAMLAAVSGVSAERVDFGASLMPWVRTSGVSISGK